MPELSRHPIQNPDLKKGKKVKEGVWSTCGLIIKTAKQIKQYL